MIRQEEILERLEFKKGPSRIASQATGPEQDMGGVTSEVSS